MVDYRGFSSVSVSVIRRIKRRLRLGGKLSVMNETEINCSCRICGYMAGEISWESRTQPPPIMKCVVDDNRNVDARVWVERT